MKKKLLAAGLLIMFLAIAAIGIRNYLALPDYVRNRQMAEADVLYAEEESSNNRGLEYSDEIRIMLETHFECRLDRVSPSSLVWRGEIDDRAIVEAEVDSAGFLIDVRLIFAWQNDIDTDTRYIKAYAAFMNRNLEADVLAGVSADIYDRIREMDNEELIYYDERVGFGINRNDNEVVFTIWDII